MMQHLFEDRNRSWLKDILAGRYLMLFLDYDGTLVPIASTPDEAVLPQETRELLERLKDCERLELAVISGRGLMDLKKLVKVKDIIYVGNHGFEIEGPFIKFESLITPRFKDVLNEISAGLKKELHAMEGVFIEDKGLSLSVHYRRAAGTDIPGFEKTFHSLIRPYLSKDEIRLGKGKMVFEIRPPLDWDKGKAIQWLLSHKQFAFPREVIYPVSLGDDTTDEDAFLAVHSQGLAILVGAPRPSHAKYFLKNSEEVIRFLNDIWECKHNGAIRHRG